MSLLDVVCKPIGVVHSRFTQASGMLHFSDNDMMDQTPVLDIKPYVPALDVRHTDRVGWFADRLAQLPVTRSDERMA